ncbi:MAG: CDP-archaeol synthase [Promethearchaeota archaeon]
MRRRRIKDDPNIDPKQWQNQRRFVLIFVGILLATLLIWSIIYTLLDALIVMGLAFFILVPAFATNGMMVLAGKIKGIPRFPLDGGRYHKDGERFLGDGKSWNGFIGGWIAGALVSAAICWWFFILISNAEEYWMLKFYTQDYILNFISAGLDPKSFWLSQIFIALGSPIGDAIGSYFKRRKKHKRGESFFFWDQNDFIIVSGLIALIWFPLKWYYWIFMLIMTPILTGLANLIGYYINKKDVPW